eukprot:jgi/Chlat1/5422/Chrsp35S05316
MAAAAAAACGWLSLAGGGDLTDCGDRWSGPQLLAPPQPQQPQARKRRPAGSLVSLAASPAAAPSLPTSLVVASTTSVHKAAMDAAVRSVASHRCSAGEQVPARFPLLKSKSTPPGRARVHARHMVATHRQLQARRLVAMAQDSQGANAEEPPEEQPPWLQVVLEAIAGVKTDVARVEAKLQPIREGWDEFSGGLKRLAEKNVRTTIH